MKYYVFSQEEIAELKEFFLRLPLNADRTVSKKLLIDFVSGLKEGSEVLALSDIQHLKNQLSEELLHSPEDGSSQIDLGEFLKIISRIKARDEPEEDKEPLQKAPIESLSVPLAQKSICSISTSTGSTHTYSVDERNMFVHYINNMLVLQVDDDLEGIIPMEGENFFKSFSNGILLCKLVNAVHPKTISEKKIGNSSSTNKSPFRTAETLVAGLQGCKSIGITLVNIGPSDFIECKEYLVLGVIWQLLKADILSQVALTKHPELCRLVKENESLESLMYIPPEQVLIRWVNHHLSKAGYPKQISNFGSDLKNSEIYAILLHQIADVPSHEIINDTDLMSRAEKVIYICNNRLDCDVVLGPQNIVEGNDRLNLALVASLFNSHSGIELPPKKNLLNSKTRTQYSKSDWKRWKKKLGPYKLTAQPQQPRSSENTRHQ